MTVFLFILIAAGAYFLGGLNGAIISSRLVYREDIRSHGSGNPGLTNFYRTYGGRAVFLLVLIDVLKTAVPVVVGGMLLEAYATFATVEERLIIGRLWGGFFSMLGHVYPCLYGFRGGKAVLAGGTAALFIDWRVALIVWGIFLLAVLLTRYVSLGSVLAGAAFPFAFVLLGFGVFPIVLSFLCGALIVYRHGGNLGRLFRGEERRLQFRRKKGGEGDGS